MRLLFFTVNRYLLARDVCLGVYYAPQLDSAVEASLYERLSGGGHLEMTVARQSVVIFELLAHEA